MAAMDEEKTEENTAPSARPGIYVSDLPANIRESARYLVTEMDANGDGYLDEGEIALAVNALRASRKQNRRLTKVVGGLTLAALLLVGAVFGVSIAAAHLAKETTLDENAITHDRRTGAVVQTVEALRYSDNLDVVGMTNEELAKVRDISLFGGDLQFQVKGFVRYPASGNDERKVALLVEGGTITFGKDSIVETTGDARSFVTIASGALSSASGAASASDESDEHDDSSSSNYDRKHRGAKQSGYGAQQSKYGDGASQGASGVGYGHTSYYSG